ncbi:PAS and ANTAR domain-containing protein [Arthrobacter sp. ISL-85]|uniref:PAS and ANTAR domain-containing protein n=1 Tax=Arthrobacter sp. ISL-85 TaxID=2819115 RepID=UPI002034CBEE|nr:PAS and ANTAR domain-containing protein [Arthrobacter sp. ISL-85]
MDWTEGVYEIHGFRRHQIVPTVKLMLAHQHPEDREPLQRLLKKLAEKDGQLALLHRVIDTRGRQRQVFSSFNAAPGEHGRVETATGFMVDLTRSMHEETRQTAEDAIHGALGHMAVIEQAKGIIMALLSVSGETAFGILTGQSQHTNTKLHILAANLVNAIEAGNGAAVVQTVRGAQRTPS